MIISKFNKLGPGLLYAAAAIGVSHLVQSTRAGADFGYQLIWVVLLANLLKYPFFQIGPKYTAITGNSLLVGYKNLGTWALALFSLITIATMFIIQAAVTVVTAGLAMQIFGIELAVTQVSLLVLIVCGLILLIGRYSILDNFVKVIVIVLTITTIGSFLFGQFGDYTKIGNPASFDWSNKTHIFFFIALVGWMPAPMDVPVWQSLWCVAKNRKSENRPDLRETMTDFKIGFYGTALLAVCFLGLGATVMYDSGIIYSGKAGAFAGQLIDMYTSAIGEWAKPIIAVAAFTTMFSTTLTCLDAFPRVLREATLLLGPSFLNPDSKKIYSLWLVLTIAGATIILFYYLSNMKALVDMATILSFLIAPILAYLNYRVMFAKEIPEAFHPQGFLKYLSWAGMFFFVGFSLYYLAIRFF